MSGEALALETQLLLQEVTQAKQFEVTVDGDGDNALPPMSEFEAAKLALVEKLRKKKEQNRQQQQQLNAKRYGIKTMDSATNNSQAAEMSTGPGTHLTPTKVKHAARLPVAATGHAGQRMKKDLLSKLRSQAIQQGAQEMAKHFGYKSYEEQIKNLNTIEKKKILESEKKEKSEEMQTQNELNTNGAVVDDKEDEDSSSDFVDEGIPAEEEQEQEQEGDEEGEAAGDGAKMDHGAAGFAAPSTDEAAAPPLSVVDVAVDSMQEDGIAQTDSYEETQDLEALEAEEARAAALYASTPHDLSPQNGAALASNTVRRRRNHIALDEEEDGNEADSEEDGKEGAEEEDDDEEEKTPRDKAAAFRQLLQAEAAQNRKRKRLRKGGDNFLDDEAEEDEEEDVLKIGGLGDFGFGVPQTSKESKDAEDERNALKLREDDLEGIVDDLSDDERAQEQDLDEIYRRELEEQDRQQVKEVMRNVKEGFGRNRRAYSSLDGGTGARGRFNLNELVAADGDKSEAARLGLLESDEDMNDDDDDDGEADESEKKAAEAEEEEDEEAEMERLLRERYQNQPKIYITSSESENEDENEVDDKDDEAVKDEIESDEERERQQMKLFSERARINRRMQRMKDMQRQIAEDTEQQEPSLKAPLPNLLLEEDEDSQSLLKVLNRTDISTVPTESGSKHTTSTTTAVRSKPTARPKTGRFSSFGMGSSVARSTSSFSRVVDNCKLFSAGSSSSTAKGFVFTSFSSDRTDRSDENAAPGAEDSNLADEAPASSASLTKSKSWGGSSTVARPAKRPFAASNGASGVTGNTNKKQKSNFFSALSSYQCVSQSTD